MKDKIKGGKGDKVQLKDLSSKQILQVKKGMKHEMEHTKDREIAQEIAIDHVLEDEHYYDKLEKAGLEQESMHSLFESWRKFLKENAEQDSRTEWKVTTNPENFLNLAKADTTGNVQLRAKTFGKFDPEKAGYIQLIIDPNTGKVTSHDGRARSQMALNSGVKEIELTIKIDSEKATRQWTWAELPSYFTPEDDRGGHVAKSEFKLKKESSEVNFEDILKLGSTPKIFQRVVLQNPSGPFVRDDPNVKVPLYIDVRYSQNYTPALRRSAGMKDTAGELPVPIMQAFSDYIDLINKQYSITDETGQELKVVRQFPRSNDLKLDKQAKGDVTLTRK